MKNLISSKSLKYGTLFLFILVLSFSVSANSWAQYQNDFGRRGFESLYTSQWGVTGILLEEEAGANFQPLVFDADRDNKTELIVSNGNFLQVYEYTDSEILVLKDELDMGSAQDVMMTTAVSDLDGDGFIEFIGVFDGQNITVFEYNSSNTLYIERQNSSNNYVIRTGIACLNHSGVIGCWAGAWNGTNSSIVEFNPATSGIQAGGSGYELSSADSFSTTNSARVSPPVGDIDRDGDMELIFIYDHDDNADEGIAVWETTSASFDISFSSDGYIDNIGGGDLGKIAGTMIVNVQKDVDSYESCIQTCKDNFPWYLIITPLSAGRLSCMTDCFIDEYTNTYGGGNSEVVITWYKTGGVFSDQDSYMNVYNSDGSSLWSTTVRNEGSSSTTTKISNPVIHDIDGDSEWEICAVVYDSDSSVSNRKFSPYCYDDDSGTKETPYSDSVFFKWGNVDGTDVDRYWTGTGTITMADLDNDNYMEIVMGTSFIDFPYIGTNYIAEAINISSSDYVQSHVALSDLNNDGVLEVIGMDSGDLYVASPSFDDSIPTLTDSFGRSWDNPVCKDTALRYSAKEYDESGTQPTGTNYYNDIDTQTERLGIDCYGNGTISYGSYSLANPYQDCTYDTVGTFYATVYLQDVGNPTDLTQYEDITILVVDGTPGITCNAVSVDIGEDSLEDVNVTTAISNPTTDGVTTFLGFLTGEDDNAKIFIGFMILLIIVISVGGFMASVTHSGIAVAIIIGIIGIAGFIVLTAIGLFPVWLLVIMLLILSLSTVLAVAFKVGGG